MLCECMYAALKSNLSILKPTIYLFLKYNTTGMHFTSILIASLQRGLIQF